MLYRQGRTVKENMVDVTYGRRMKMKDTERRVVER